MSFLRKSLVFFFFFLFISDLLLISTVAANYSDILYEVEPFVRVYTNGTVERLSGTEVVPASLYPNDGVRSKDVTIDPKLDISARLFLPKITTTPAPKFPILVYFHGGGFFTDSPFSPTYHNYLNSLVGEANVVAVSVNYRLAPENPLPIAYQDSWLALRWVFSHCTGNGTELWLNKYADFGSVYFGGDSAGANIAHNMAIRVGLEKPDLEVHGMFLNCPHFWGSARIGDEACYPTKVAWEESIWIHAYPNSTGFDDPLLNPAMNPDLSKLGCKRVLVYVAEYDILRDRGWEYKKTMEKSEWDRSVKAVEVKGKVHVFNLRFPEDSKSKEMLQDFALFLNSNNKLEGVS